MMEGGNVVSRALGVRRRTLQLFRVLSSTMTLDAYV